MTQPLGGVIAVDDDAVERLLAEADGRPYVLQKLALAAVQRVHEDRPESNHRRGCRLGSAAI